MFIECRVCMDGLPARACSPAGLCPRHADMHGRYWAREKAKQDAMMRRGRALWVMYDRIAAVCEWMLRLAYSDESHADANYRFRREVVVRKRLVARNRRFLK